ncbi:MAG: amidase domain-containing protein [Clostridiales bacterium]|jgi:hypothetical protein|nr:amidase domain-containing protein [Clostridiales bacterium]MDR2713439.1 amidase domain-containing protein [Clostridiales bacterium]
MGKNIRQAVDSGGGKILLPWQENASEGSSKPSFNNFAAVEYAMLWWNKRNPDFLSFEDNCTNFISQCLYAGGLPMKFAENPEHGWWMKRDRWSYSWSVAHSLRWYLPGIPFLHQVATAWELAPGDLISYSWGGNNVWNHFTIVTGIDRNNEPLVNANTMDSRLRHWAYQDSPSFTRQTKYIFWHFK